jgi:hypothetical protein
VCGFWVLIGSTPQISSNSRIALALLFVCVVFFLSFLCVKRTSRDLDRARAPSEEKSYFLWFASSHLSGQWAFAEGGLDASPLITMQINKHVPAMWLSSPSLHVPKSGICHFNLLMQ